MPPTSKKIRDRSKTPIPDIALSALADTPSSRFQLQNEAGAFGICAVEGKPAVHTGCTQGTDGQAEAVTLGKVAHTGERFENLFALLFRDTGTCIGDDVLVCVRAAFLELNRYSAVFRRMVFGISQQMP